MTVTEVEEAITLSYHGAEELEVQEFSWRFTTGESSLEVAKKYSTVSAINFTDPSDPLLQIKKN